MKWLFRDYRKKVIRTSIILSAFLVLSMSLFIILHASASPLSSEAQLDLSATGGQSLEETRLTLLNGSNSYSPTISTNAALPLPNTDPCLHCHIIGEEKGIWTPLARWVLFGSMGLIMVFGVFRTASVVVNRTSWKPITTRAVEWVDERYSVSEPMSKILSKPVPKFALRWWYCLGGITAFLFVIQGITGIMLAFYYQPHPDTAYASIQFIETQVQFGAAFRAIHHWAANGMIIMCIAHMLRVFIMGAYKAPRELNWVSGMLLLILTLAFGFTGYLLPWDQRAFWATTVGSDIAGAIPVIGNLALIFLRVGWDVSGATLGRFYALHIIIIPLATVAFMLAHFIMIRRQGIMRPL